MLVITRWYLRKASIFLVILVGVTVQPLENLWLLGLKKAAVCTVFSSIRCLVEILQHQQARNQTMDHDVTVRGIHPEQKGNQNMAKWNG